MSAEVPVRLHHAPPVTSNQNPEQRKVSEWVHQQADEHLWVMLRKRKVQRVCECYYLLYDFIKINHCTKKQKDKNQDPGEKESSNSSLMHRNTLKMSFIKSNGDKAALWLIIHFKNIYTDGKHTRLKQIYETEGGSGRWISCWWWWMRYRSFDIHKDKLVQFPKERRRFRATRTRKLRREVGFVRRNSLFIQNRVLKPSIESFQRARKKKAGVRWCLSLNRS